MYTKTANGTAVTEEPRWPEIFTQLQSDEVEFFLNSQLEPMLLIPSDGFRKEWPVDSKRVQDLLATMYYEMTEGILKSTETNVLLSLIREECRRGGRRMTEGEAEATDQDVLVQGMVALVNESCVRSPPALTDQTVFHGRTVLVQEHLSQLQKSGIIDMCQAIPVFTNIFARKLNRLIPVLHGYGVGVIMEHKEDGSYTTVKRLATFQPEMSKEAAEADASRYRLSGESSGGTASGTKGSAPPDDTDGNFRGDPPKINEATTFETAKKGGAQ